MTAVAPAAGAGRERVASVARALLLGYCAVFLAAWLLGAAGVRLRLWEWIVARGADALVLLLQPGPGPAILLPALLLLPLLLRFASFSPLRVAGAELLALGVLVAHGAAAVTAVADPQTAARITVVGSLLLLPVRRRLWAGLSRWPALASALVFFLALAGAGSVGFSRAIGSGSAGHDPSPGLRLPGDFDRPYDVIVLGDTGDIAILAGESFRVVRMDPDRGEIVGDVAFPDGLRPQRGAFDPVTGRLFVVGHALADPEEAALAVLSTTDVLEIEAWLPMPGCRNVVNVALRIAAREVASLCEESPLLFFYDADGLAPTRVEEPRGDFYTAYDLAFWGDAIAVTSSPWPFLLVGSPGGGARSGGRHWIQQRLGAFALGLAADARTGRLYAASPLERRVAVFERGRGDAVASIDTAGKVRDVELDTDAGWLFTGSYFIGVVEQFDVTTGDRLGAWTVGEALRGVAWDPRRRRVYTASGAGIHRIELAP